MAPDLLAGLRSRQASELRQLINTMSEPLRPHASMWCTHCINLLSLRTANIAQFPIILIGGTGNEAGQSELRRNWQESIRIST